MTLEERSKELVKRFKDAYRGESHTEKEIEEYARSCAQICLEEILFVLEQQKEVDERAYNRHVAMTKIIHNLK